MSRKFLNVVFTAVVLIFLVPTSLILVSWNAIPGDGLYPLKTGLEDVTLIALSGTPFVPGVSEKFTERRFNEATTLLAKKGSTVGYELLVAEAMQTQTLIANKNDSAAASTFVQNIDEYQQKIEQTKAEVQTQVPVGLTPSPTPSSTVAPEITSGQVTKQQIIIQKETPQQVLQNLDNTEVELEKIKKQVQKDLPENSNAQKNGQDKGHK